MGRVKGPGGLFSSSEPETIGVNVEQKERRRSTSIERRSVSFYWKQTKGKPFGLSQKRAPGSLRFGVRNLKIAWKRENFALSGDKERGLPWFHMWAKRRAFPSANQANFRPKKSLYFPPLWFFRGNQPLQKWAAPSPFNDTTDGDTWKKKFSPNFNHAKRFQL